jgi:hypothetical protein
MIDEIKKTPNAVVIYYHSHWGRKCMTCYPKRPHALCPELLKYLKFKYMVRIGETFWDVYDVQLTQE